MNPDLIVVDTNVFISAILSPNGTTYQALNKALKHFTIVHSRETHQELTQRIYKPKFDPSQYQNLVISPRDFLNLD
ncbi:MAG: hypothetical protein SAJ12_22285 [Jaaginema sp. PMC 1079.18]|nr:hypothetical protein [Jaaginema sp. PMC 1080.18]MEC4853719.1 hypothetical protein [Jaaginema sp. PMC 1079.18]MEC4866947.1 hypothetical protein [Jaaginema sp. PMC 1078.18]